MARDQIQSYDSASVRASLVAALVLTQRKAAEVYRQTEILRDMIDKHDANVAALAAAARSGTQERP